MSDQRQECLDRAVRFLAVRMHSRAELKRKLQRGAYSAEIIEGVLADLERLGYVDDERFARERAEAAGRDRKHGGRRVYADLVKAGVAAEAARAAVEGTRPEGGDLELARQLAAKELPRLRRLDPLVARRRLAGMLYRRGFEQELIATVVNEVLGDLDQT